MASDSPHNALAPPWTLAGFNLGMRLALPVLPGMMAFGLALFLLYSVTWVLIGVGYRGRDS